MVVCWTPHSFKANTEKEKGRERVALFQGAKPRTLEEGVSILLEGAGAKEWGGLWK